MADGPLAEVLLRRLEAASGGLDSAELAAELGVEHQAVVGAVKSLQALGEVSRAMMPGHFTFASAAHLPGGRSFQARLPQEPSPECAGEASGTSEGPRARACSKRPPRHDQRLGHDGGQGKRGRCLDGGCGLMGEIRR